MGSDPSNQTLVYSAAENVKTKILGTPENSISSEVESWRRGLLRLFLPEWFFPLSHLEHRYPELFAEALTQLSVDVARGYWGFSAQKYEIRGVIREGRLRRIAETLSRLEHRPRDNEEGQRPDWNKELAYIMRGKGQYIPVTVVCDVYAVNQQTGDRFAFDLKAPLPHGDQTKVGKEKIFKLYCMEPPQVEGAYYALPYNPYGKRENYAWSFPSRWFNMKDDEVVLIGDEFWEKIGGLDTYQAFIDAVNEIGWEYKERIYREYLGIEPLPDALEESLS